MVLSETQLARARFVRTVLAWHDLTQADLAQLLRITPQATNRKLKGIRQFRDDELLAIAEAFNIDPGKLLRPPPLDKDLGDGPVADFAALPSWPYRYLRWSEALFRRSFERSPVVLNAA